MIVVGPEEGVLGAIVEGKPEVALEHLPPGEMTRVADACLDEDSQR